MTDANAYHYCNRCRLEKCVLVDHSGVCHHQHDELACIRENVSNPDWLIEFAYLILSQYSLRYEIAGTLIREEDWTSWDAGRWGAWAAAPYRNHLSNATLIVVFYLMFHI